MKERKMPFAVKLRNIVFKTFSATFLLIIFIVTAFYHFLVLLALIKGLNPFKIWFIHGPLYVGTALLHGLASSYFSKSKTILEAWFYFTIVLLFSFYGVIGILCIFLYQRFGSAGLNDDELSQFSFSGIQAEDDFDERDLKSVNEMVRFELNIKSYYDIMRGNSPELKKALISKIQGEWSYADIKLLRMAIEDEDYEIRTYASVVLGKIEKEINEKILSLKNDIVFESDRVFDLKTKLVYTYYYYMKSGFLDKKTRTNYLQECHTLLNEAEKLKSDTRRNRLKVKALRTKLLDFSDDDEFRKKEYYEILNQFPHQYHTFIRLGEILFKERRIEALRKLCENSSNRYAHGQNMGHVIKLWREP